ncbi:hypothetical protein PVOR_03595 [Paenibacillus vortex V453]|uniref:SEC-C motif domain protein n=1 Tax=Paenibacillus vortex V453 TaxID=715225 RepID=A0A2R9T186_9BACL|nr:SEC-C domain-containing protein [Paenibacillus vortex]EFU43408.1 hypothetical protein PVOR_03595 [Paenibacillus vortex V453]
MNENQFMKRMKNITYEAIKRFDESFEKNTYEYVLQYGFNDEGKYILFNGIGGNDFCPCGSGQKYKVCCSNIVEKLINSLERCTYVGSYETTKDRKKLPLSFNLSPIFELDIELNGKDKMLVRDIIHTHPTVVNYLYIISAKELAKAYAESEYARYMLNMIYDLEEDADANWEDFKKDNRPLNEKEKLYLIENKTAVPTATESMRRGIVEWLSSSQFILQR